MLHGDEARELIGSPAYVAALVEPRGGKLNPLSYARGLARAAQAAGAVVSPQSPVTGLERSGDGWTVRTPKAEVSAGRVLLATNGYTGDLWPSLKQTIIPVASFIIATKPLSDNVRRTILRDGHVISDTRRMLTYSRLDPEGRLVVGARGKWQDPMGVSDFAHVKKTLQDLFPQVGDIGEPAVLVVRPGCHHAGLPAARASAGTRVDHAAGLQRAWRCHGHGNGRGGWAGTWPAVIAVSCRCLQPASGRSRFTVRGACMWRLRLPGTGCWTTSICDQLLPVVVACCGKGLERQAAAFTRMSRYHADADGGTSVAAWRCRNRARWHRQRTARGTSRTASARHHGGLADRC
jgi:hypothetical protein